MLTYMQIFVLSTYYVQSPILGTEDKPCIKWKTIPSSVTINSGVEDSKLLMTSQCETRDGLFLINKPVTHVRKCSVVKATIEEIFIVRSFYETDYARRNRSDWQGHFDSHG